jgi:hypothetical protein
MQGTARYCMRVHGLAARPERRARRVRLSIVNRVRLQGTAGGGNQWLIVSLPPSLCCGHGKKRLPETREREIPLSARRKRATASCSRRRRDSTRLRSPPERYTVRAPQPPANPRGRSDSERGGRRLCRVAHDAALCSSCCCVPLSK